jgi:hypothetical protein
MTWDQAVRAMRDGHIVRRKGEMWVRVIEEAREAEPDEDDHEWSMAGIRETGQEGCYLAHAWTHDEKPVQVFMGASSKCLFVPDDEHRSARDWVIVERANA